MTYTRMLLAAAMAFALASVIALPTHAAPTPIVSMPAQATAPNGKDTPTVNIRNTAARIVHLNLGPHGIVAINPLADVNLTGDQARAAKEALDTSLKALIEDGTLVVDGSAKAPPPNPEPAGATTNMGDPRLAPTASDLGNNDPGASGTPDTPSSSGSGKRSK